MGRAVAASWRLVFRLSGLGAAILAVVVLADVAGGLGVRRDGRWWLELAISTPLRAEIGSGQIGRVIRLRVDSSGDSERGLPANPGGGFASAGEPRPVSALLPRAGGGQLALESAAPRPFPTSPPAPPTATTAPNPTFTPLPTATASPSITPPPTITPTPTDDLAATVIAFAAQVTPEVLPETCAPRGWPVVGSLVQRFHARHSGVDLTVPSGTPVLATHSGVVTWAGWNVYGYGNLVIVQNGAFITYYAHLTAPNVAVGDWVLRGTIIGWSGSTGRSSGPHVHYETRIDDVPVDPESFESSGEQSC